MQSPEQLDPIIISTDTQSLQSAIRIDKWLWAARFFKTRSQAAAAIESAKVRVNQQRVKPAYVLKIDDLLDIDNGSVNWQVQVKQLSDQRRAAAIAQHLYAETADSLGRREQQAEQRKYFREPSAVFKTRPTKRDRRKLDNAGS